MTRKRYKDRFDAGRHLAEKLREGAWHDDGLLLGIARDGVPVAYAMAQELELPLDVFVVRRLAVRGGEGTPFGAITTGGGHVLDERVIEDLALSPEEIGEIEAKEREELDRRERLYRGDRPPPELRGRTVVLVDDGVGTGFTVLAAVQAVRVQDPERLVVAVPIAPADVRAALELRADEVVCQHAPATLDSVANWYEQYSATTDEEVRDLLGGATASR
jgi:predicted phosphoribosyltransferase